MRVAVMCSSVACLFVQAFLFCSCKEQTNDGTKVREFINVQPTNERLPVDGVSLSSLESKIPGLAKQDYVVTKTRFASQVPRVANVNIVGIEFPNLSKQRCEEIRAYYGNISKIACKDGPFSLQDFLFPSIQATINKQFANENITTKIDQYRDEIDALQNNCWSTTFEVQRRASNDFYLFQMNAKEAKRLLRDETWSSKVSGESESVTSEDAVRAMLKSSQFGDVILIYNTRDLSREGGRARGELLHAATVIDGGGVAFERTGWDRNFAMRFVAFDDIISQYSPGVSGSAWELRRMNKAFPAPGKAIQDWSYGGELQGRFNCARIPFVFDADGRASLPPEAFKSIRQSPFMSSDCSETP